MNVPLDASGNLAFFAYRARFPRDIFTAGGWISRAIAFRERKGVSDADGLLRWHIGHPGPYRGHRLPLLGGEPEADDARRERRCPQSATA